MINLYTHAFVIFFWSIGLLRDCGAENVTVKNEKKSSKRRNILFTVTDLIVF